MDNKLIELLSEDIRETRNLTIAVQQETKEIRKVAEEAGRKADAAWELVIMTREQINKPFRKRLFR